MKKDLGPYMNNLGSWEVGCTTLNHQSASLRFLKKWRVRGGFGGPVRQFTSRPCHLNNAHMSGSQRGSQAGPQWPAELPVTSAFATTTRFESLLLLGFFTPECMPVLGLAPSMGGMELNRSGSCLGRVLRGGGHVPKLSHVISTVLSAEC